MEPSIVIAIITSIAALIGTLINSFIILRTNRTNQQNTLELERVKAEIEESKRYAIKEEQKEIRNLHAAKEAQKSIQIVKDIILDLVDGHYRKSEILKRIQNMRELIFFNYQEHFTELSNPEQGLFHTAKNISLSVVNVGKKFIEETSIESKNELRRELMNIRESLNAFQKAIEENTRN